MNMKIFERLSLDRFDEYKISMRLYNGKTRNSTLTLS